MTCLREKLARRPRCKTGSKCRAFFAAFACALRSVYLKRPQVSVGGYYSTSTSLWASRCFPFVDLCDGVAIIISVLVDFGCVLRRELFPCSVLFYAVSLR